MNALTKQNQSDQSMATISDNASLMNAIAMAARDPTVDMDKMERLFAMHQRMEDRQREEAFASAMTAAQKAMPSIGKDATNKHTQSDYATLEHINKAITPIYTGQGLSLSFDTAESAIADHIRILCHVLHSGGHSKTYSYDAPLDDVGIKGEKNKTPTHARGSAISYGRRYLTLMIFNLTLGGEDDDGNAAGNKIDGVAQEWVAVADALEDPDAYTSRRREAAEAYGGPAKVPAIVAEAFTRAKARVLPKD